VKSFQAVNKANLTASERPVSVWQKDLSAFGRKGKIVGKMGNYSLLPIQNYFISIKINITK